MLRRIHVDDAIERALRDVDAAERAWEAGGVPYSVVEIPKLALADRVLQAARRATLPTRAGAGVRAELPPKVRRRHA